MNDGGTNGDLVAGDGVYTGQIPAQSAGVMVAFYVQARDRGNPAATGTFPVDAPNRECLARVGETQPTGNFPVYRVWVRQTTLDQWTSRNKMDNTPLDATFVLANSRVIYNAQILYAGSPYIAPGYCGPTCGSCGYSLTFPDDDLFLGDNDLVLDWPGGHGGETSAMQEQMGYWITERLGLPFSHRYTIRLHVNGVTDDARGTVFEAVNQPAKSFLKAWSSDLPEGDFFKVERAFEFSDAGGVMADPEPSLLDFTTTGGAKKRERYRWNFVFRGSQNVNDYTNVYALVDALNSTAPEPYTSATFGLVDVNEWMRMFAAEHIINNFDAYGHEIGKNMYAYFPQGGRWQLYMFDLDWLMLAAPNLSSVYANGGGPLFNVNDPAISRMYSHPPFLRAYWRAIQDAVDGPLNPGLCDPVMDSKYRSLVANGVRYCDGKNLTNPDTVKTWFSQRRANLQGQLAGVASGFTVAKTGSFTVSSNLVTLSGTAPISIETLLVNGTATAVTWTSVSNWTLRVPVPPGSTPLSIVGVDAHGQAVPGASNQVTVIYSAPGVPPAAGSVALSEIMFAPRVPDAEFVELYNSSPTNAFDLSGWIFNGLSYTFPGGSFIAPKARLILVKNRVAFNSAYGPGFQVFDQFPGNLQADGEMLTLFQPGTNGVPGPVIDQVRYAAGLPWPQGAGGTGASLQLVDDTQENWRAGNWAVATTNAGAVPQWVYFATTGPASSSRLYLYLQSAGDIYLDDIHFALGAVPNSGVNLATNGGFETPLGTEWNLTGNFTQSVTSTNVKHSGAASLHLVATAAGAGSGNAIYQDLPLTATNQVCSISFWYLQTTNGGPLVVRLSGTGLTSGSLNTAPTAQTPLPAAATPGTLNSLAASLPAFPDIHLNEVQPENLTGVTNRFGQRTAWIELLNRGTNQVSLTNLFLSGDFSNLPAWAFPAGAALNPGEYRLVFADGQPALTVSNEWHANLAPPAGAGRLVVSRRSGNEFQVLDYLAYTNLGPNRSFGSVPDGQPFERREMVYPTPGSTNNGASAPLTVTINEWMAGNTNTIRDPVTGKFEDWFELYNFGTNPVSLAGYYLTHSLTNQFEFLIPSGYVIPPGGFLLVWADKKSTNNTPDLHVNFKLNKAGASIGLYGADGRPVDYVTFGPQSEDISMGRFPDGNGTLEFMVRPSPGTNNLFNSPPELAFIPDQVIILGQTLRFYASASDVDVPAQTLTFSLESSSPSEASIDPATGQFSWTPAGDAAVVFTMTVTDDGLPARTASRSFTVTVLPPPTLGGAVSADARQFTISWQTAPGKLYQVEFKDDLSGPVWLPLGNPILATTESTTVNQEFSAASVRFFRIRILP
jgi:hypothetical protein